MFCKRLGLRTHPVLLLLTSLALSFGGTRLTAAQSGPLGCPDQVTIGANPWNPCNWDAHKIMDAINNPHADLVTVAAHRGTHSLAGTSQAPGVAENSLEAIGIAAKNGWESIEIDVKVTSDGVAVLSHDKVWGKEACFSDQNGYFKPFASQPAKPGTAQNPIVDQTPFASLSPHNGGVLRDSVSVPQGDQSCFNPTRLNTPAIPTLQSVYDFIKVNNIQMVVTLDIQGLDRAAASWKVVQANTDNQGHPYSQTTMFKIPAALFPDISTYQRTFPNSQNVNFNPVFHTSGIAPASPCIPLTDFNDIDDAIDDIGDPLQPGCPPSFEGEANMIQWIKLFSSSPYVYLSAIEVSMKDPYPSGILSSVKTFVNNLTIGSRHVSISSFNPVGEYIDSTDARPHFYSSGTGEC